MKRWTTQQSDRYGRARELSARASLKLGSDPGPVPESRFVRKTAQAQPTNRAPLLPPEAYFWAKAGTLAISLSRSTREGGTRTNYKLSGRAGELTNRPTNQPRSCWLRPLIDPLRDRLIEAARDELLGLVPWLASQVSPEAFFCCGLLRRVRVESVRWRASLSQTTLVISLNTLATRREILRSAFQIFSAACFLGISVPAQSSPSPHPHPYPHQHGGPSFAVVNAVTLAGAVTSIDALCSSALHCTSHCIASHIALPCIASHIALTRGLLSCDTSAQNSFLGFPQQPE